MARGRRTRTRTPRQAVERGELHIELFGEKLRGHVILVRTKGYGGRGGSGDKESWLVMHKRDEHAVEGWEPEDHPHSVLSGRTNDEVAANPDRLWTRGDGEQPVHPSPPEFAPATADELAELDALPEKATWSVQGCAVKLTNLDKVLFPPGDEGVPR